MSAIGNVWDDEGMLREVWRFRELLYFLVWRDLKIRYRQSVLGAAWAILQPFGTMVVFSLVFCSLAKMPSDGVPYPIFSYAALLPWIFFSSAITNAGASMVGNRDLITKVYFPRITIPIASVLGGVVDFFIGALMLIAMMWYYHVAPTWSLLLWPVLLLPLSLLATSVGVFFSALNVKYRDIKYALPFLIQLWLFITPIAYPLSAVPARYRPWLELNPLCGIIDAFRAALLPSMRLNVGLLAISMGLTLLSCVFSILYFRRAEERFADIV